MPIVACRTCIYEKECEGKLQNSFTSAARCVEGQIYWTEKEKLEEFKRLSKWLIVPKEILPDVQNKCLEERRKRLG
jgi:hypothetical protein